jgi:hypothetical protein
MWDAVILGVFKRCNSYQGLGLYVANGIDTLYLDGSYRVIVSTGQSGSKRYQCAMASVSRALARLIKRGLVERQLIYRTATVKTGNTHI